MIRFIISKERPNLSHFPRILNLTVIDILIELHHYENKHEPHSLGSGPKLAESGSNEPKLYRSGSRVKTMSPNCIDQAWTRSRKIPLHTNIQSDNLLHNTILGIVPNILISNHDCSSARFNTKPKC